MIGNWFERLLEYRDNTRQRQLTRNDAMIHRPDMIHLRYCTYMPMLNYIFVLISWALSNGEACWKEVGRNRSSIVVPFQHLLCWITNHNCPCQLRDTSTKPSVRMNRQFLDWEHMCPLNSQQLSLLVAREWISHAVTAMCVLYRPHLEASWPPRRRPGLSTFFEEKFFYHTVFKVLQEENSRHLGRCVKLSKTRRWRLFLCLFF